MSEEKEKSLKNNLKTYPQNIKSFIESFFKRTLIEHDCYPPEDSEKISRIIENMEGGLSELIAKITVVGLSHFLMNY